MNSRMRNPGHSFGAYDTSSVVVPSGGGTGCEEGGAGGMAPGGNGMLHGRGGGGMIIV